MIDRSVQSGWSAVSGVHGDGNYPGSGTRAGVDTSNADRGCVVVTPDALIAELDVTAIPGVVGVLEVDQVEDSSSPWPTCRPRSTCSTWWPQFGRSIRRGAAARGLGTGEVNVPGLAAGFAEQAVLRRFAPRGPQPCTCRRWSDAATLTAVRASISTPVFPDVVAVATMLTLLAASSNVQARHPPC